MSVHLILLNLLLLVSTKSSSAYLYMGQFSLHMASKGSLPKSLSRSMSMSLPSWEDIALKSRATERGAFLVEQEALWKQGGGLPHTDANLRLFGTKEEPRVTYFRDTAAWCPYCQKVWILLEEKKIPFKVEKVNMRSYGVKPAEFLRKVPSGLLPAAEIDGQFMTDSLNIMLLLDRKFRGPSHRIMWPDDDEVKLKRASALMRLERELFGAWCDLVFRSSFGGGSRKRFEATMDRVDRAIGEDSNGPWFLGKDLTIVDLTYITHVERMCASVPYWCGFKVRGDNRWPNIEKWMSAFEELPSYMATKSDYYTHVMDIPPQYGPSAGMVRDWEKMGKIVDGRAGTWTLPLSPFTASDLEPVSKGIDPGEEQARHEAAYKLQKNHENIVRFALRAVGTPGRKQFQAPLADPYAESNMDYKEEMSVCMRALAGALLEESSGASLTAEGATPELALVLKADKRVRTALGKSLAYFRDRVGVPRDMTYPAARQLRSHANHLIQSLE